MNSLVRKCAYLMAVAVLCFASSAFASTIVTMQFINATAPAAGYPSTAVAAYNFHINPPTTVITPLICDDFQDSIPSGTWLALKTSVADANATNTYFYGMPPGGYEEVAWLAEQLFAAGLSNPASVQVTNLNYAIWDIFDSAAVAGLNPAQKASVAALVLQAQGHAGDNPNMYAGVYIYTPVDANGNVLTGYARPQEFIQVTPEASTVALSGVGLLGLFSLMFLFPGKVRIA